MIFYATALFIFPKFLATRQFVRLAFALLALFALYSGIRYLLIYPLQPYLNPEDKKEPFEAGYFLIVSTRLYIDYVIFGLGYWFARASIAKEREKRLAEEKERIAEAERHKSEIAYLKSQFNPHFLYNTLNYFYSKAYHLSGELAEGILKLSEIMRYSLEESKDEWVSLTEEITHLNNLIDIHQRRFDQKLKIDFTIEGDTESKRVLPLVLISFVENAFKHGKITEFNDPLIIKLSSKREKIEFFIQNRKGRKNRFPSTGIGLVNIRQRLELAYPGKYTLDIQEDENDFTCTLLIPVH